MPSRDRPSRIRAGFKDPDHPKRQEKRLAKRSGGRRMPGSGSIPGLKSDVVVDDWRVRREAKTMDVRGRKSFSVKLDWLRKIDEESLHRGQTPVVDLELRGAKDMPAEWSLVPTQRLEELLGEPR